jgi:hypothetical protein
MSAMSALNTNVRHIRLTRFSCNRRPISRSVLQACRASSASTQPQHGTIERPENMKRSLFHAVNGVLSGCAAMLLQDGLCKGLSVFLFLGFWTGELLRLKSDTVNQIIMKAGFQHVIHPLERSRVASATWSAFLFILRTIFLLLSRNKNSIIAGP